MSAGSLEPRHLCNGLLVHPLGLNCSGVGSAGHEHESPVRGRTPDDEHFLEGLRRAVEHGATLLDTADSYGRGRSERLIGRFLQEHPNETLHLSSKVGTLRGSAPHPYAGRHIHHQLQQTLENLYVEDLSLYFLESLDFGPDDRYLGTAIDQMQTLRQLGNIKAIGMQGPYAPYSASIAERAECVRRFLYLFRLIKPDVIWTRFNGLTPAIPLEGEDLFSFTARHGVGVVLAEPLAHGLLTGTKASSSLPRGSSSPNSLLGVADFHREAEAAISSGLSDLRAQFGSEPGALTRLALRWCLQQASHCAVVVGYTNGVRVDEIFGCLGGPLTDSEKSLIDETYAQMRSSVEGWSAVGQRRSSEQAGV